MKQLSLRMRLTLVTVCLITFLAAVLTVASIYNAGNIYGQNEAFYDDEFPDEPEGFDTAQAAENPSIEFRSVSIVLTLCVIAAGAVLSYLVLGFALRPMKKLNRQIQSVNAHALNVRIESFQAGDEISQLADSFNQMLTRLETAFQTQKRFASAAAHELKTPLAAIKTTLDVLAVGDAGEDEYEQVIRVVQNQTNRMIHLTEELFAASAGDSYAFDNVVNPLKIIDDILSEQKDAINKKQLSVTAEGQENIKIQANAAMLYRTFANLIENAVKYNLDGGSILIQVTSLNQTAQIKIRDTGTGIAAEHLPHIFEPFYRVDHSRSRKIAGAGLGLTIVQDTLNRHGGRIRIESELGKGTTCLITLPILNPL